MIKKILIILLIIIFVFAFPNSEKKLINNANKIKKNIESINRKNKSEQIIISNNYLIDNKMYNSIGQGVIFLEDNYSFFLEYDNKCIMKLPYEEDLMYQKEPCPIYRMFSGIKFKIDNEKNGLYIKNNEYIFKGEKINNYILLNNVLYTIEKFNNNNMYLNNNKIIKNEYRCISGNGEKKNPYILIKKE